MTLLFNLALSPVGQHEDVCLDFLAVAVNNNKSMNYLQVHYLITM